MSKLETVNNLEDSPAQRSASQQIQTISELQMMLHTISGQLGEFHNLTDQQLTDSLSKLTTETQNRLEQLHGMTEKQLSETLEIVATDTRSQIYQAMEQANDQAESALAAMQNEASRAYDEPIGELLKQVQAISQAMAKLSDEARRALGAEVKSLRAQKNSLQESTQNIGKLLRSLRAIVVAANKENEKAKANNDRVQRQWWQVAIMAAVVSTCGSTLIVSGLWLIATR